MHFAKVFACLVFVLVSSVAARPPTSDADNEKRLIKISETDAATWLSHEEVASLIRNGQHFMDITDRQFPSTSDHVSTKAIPPTLRFHATVRNVHTKINIPRMEAFVNIFDDFPNRYYNSQNGVTSSNWLLAQINDAIASIPYSGTVSVTPVQHSWLQNSIIARIEGSDAELSKQVIIFGAHQDSINSANPINGNAPGADDNASGSVVLLESLRVLLEAGLIPKRSIEFQWYAAEEVGLRGSGDIAEDYFNRGVDVVGMVNFDVVGYDIVGTTHIGFVTDYTDPTLTSFLRMVTEEYLVYTWVDDFCGYACSDHAPWDRFGFPAACPNEYPINPHMHTIRDTINRMSFQQVAEFVKLAVAGAIEIAEPNTVVT